MSVSDWWEGQAKRDDWKCITTEDGEQSAVFSSTMLTLALSATVLDSS